MNNTILHLQKEGENLTSEELEVINLWRKKDGYSEITKYHLQGV